MASCTEGRQLGADHVVKIYDDEQDLASGVVEFIAGGITANDLVLVVATPEHRSVFTHAAEAAGLDLEAARAAGRYLAFDAREMLATIMVDGSPDPRRFATVVGELLEGAVPRRVRIFGEMVALLWEDGNVDAAIALESLWNGLSTTLPFSLYCAYEMSSFASGSELRAIRAICDHHHDVVAPESYTSSSRPPDGTAGRYSASEIFMPVPLAVRAVRRFVERTLRTWGEDALVDDAAVVASELATNAITHAKSPFSVSLERDAKSVKVTVRDTDRGAPEVRHATADTASGRGLALVAALCPAWGTSPVPDGKVVWAELAPSA